MKYVIAYPFVLLLVILFTLVDAWIFMTIWNWYLAGIFVMTMKPAYGLALVVGYTTFRAKWRKPDEDEMLYSIYESLLYTVTIFIVAWLVQAAIL